MRAFQILRFAEIEINPCNSRSNTGTKKAEWRVTIRHQGKKMVEDFYANQNLFSNFCKSLITKHSHGDTRFNAKNSVLKQAKMVSIYQRNNINDTAKRVATISFDSCGNFNHL